MPFLDHLEELRWRILKILVAIVVGTVVGWIVLDRVDIIELLKQPIAPYLPGGRLIFTSPAEPFMLTLKVAFALGCVIVSPVVIYQIWAFLSPALYEREKRLIIPALAVGAVLFLGGALACYKWLLPAALRVLLEFQRSDLAPMITIDRYFAMAVPFVVGCGLVAELPLVVTILAALGIVTPQFLARQRRYAIVVSAFLAALLTPPDAVSMMLMLVPLLLLYEISIWCAWIASRRRARRTAAAVVVLLLIGAGTASAQNPPPPPLPPLPPLPPPPAAQQPPAPDTSRRGNMDTATARRLGLPTGPTRSFPLADRIIDSLLKLPGFRITRYVADTLVVQGDSQTIFLKREAFVEREGTQVEADSIRYHEASCRLDAAGDPRLFDRGTVLVGEGMRYDTCLRRGTVRDALTDFQQGGATWYVRGHLALDSGSTRVYARAANFTSDPQPVPDYHFAAGRVKWISKRIMVARPAVLYIRDVPIMWLPFIFNDIRSDRRSGILVPRFGLNDLVRPSRHYARHVQDLGYYFVINDYVDLLLKADWYAGRTVSFQGETNYRWLNRFLQGGLQYSRTSELDGGGTANGIAWYHNQIFNSRTRFNTNITYNSHPRIVTRNSLDPRQVTATLHSSGSFSKRFSWGSLDIGGGRTQDLSNQTVSQTLPDIRITPLAVNITPWITWSPGFTFTNAQTFHNSAGSLLVPALPGGSTLVDTLSLFSDDRRTAISIQTPLRVGRWNWGNSLQINDQVSNNRQEFLISDTTVPGGVRRVLFARTFRTDVDWQTSINLPPLLSGTWKIQPSVGILNQTSAGPFMLRNQFSGGEYVRQGKRLSFSVGASPIFFGFFPGFGPLQRIRHSLQPVISYQYAPGSQAPEAFVRALDPTGRVLNARSDPQQTISFALSQVFDAKMKPPRSERHDSTAAENKEPRKIKLLSINTSAIGFNFEQAARPGRSGWQMQNLDNFFVSDLLPGFQLRTSHNLWKGDVASDTARFDPFLQSVSASFQIGPGFLRSVAGLFGLGSRHAPTPSPPSADTAQGGLRKPPGTFGQYPSGPAGSPGMYGSGYQGSGSGNFSLGVTYSSTRTRGAPTGLSGRGGQQTSQLNLSFSPTRNWRASWHTMYDFDTKQFADHFVSFERDLHRWRATFAFSKTSTGNFSFSFNISLTDQPDIKFDYDQRTFVQ
jgi:Tat protein translocase TatC